MRAGPLLLLVSLGLLGLADAGKVFIWLPLISKSIQITYTPVVEELAKRGHEVTVVHPFKNLGKIKGVTEIQSTDGLEDFLKVMSGYD